MVTFSQEIENLTRSLEWLVLDNKKVIFGIDVTTNDKHLKKPGEDALLINVKARKYLLVRLYPYTE